MACEQIFASFASPKDTAMNINFQTICIIYLAAINLFALLLMGYDKLRAAHGSWRVPEKNLFLTAIIGGSIGSLAGMYLFRHKTQHPSFTIGMPVILILQLLLAIWLIFFSPFTFLIL